MCALKSCGMSVVCTWGLRGIFFLHLYFLCSSPTVLCAALWQPSFLRMYHTISNTPNFMLKYELCAYFWPSAVKCREFSRAKAKKKVLVPRTLKKLKPKKRHKAQFTWSSYLFIKYYIWFHIMIPSFSWIHTLLTIWIHTFSQPYEFT
jgi:hypothetical protein